MILLSNANYCKSPFHAPCIFCQLTNIYSQIFILIDFNSSQSSFVLYANSETMIHPLVFHPRLFNIVRHHQAKVPHKVGVKQLPSIASIMCFGERFVECVVRRKSHITILLTAESLRFFGRTCGDNHTQGKTKHALVLPFGRRREVQWSSFVRFSIVRKRV